MASPPRSLHLPPLGRPRWVCPPESQLDLLYLSWGWRNFHESPVPVSRHPGWVFVAVRQGAPTLAAKTGMRRVSRCEAVMIHPEAATGWTDGTPRRAELLTWVWRTPPRLPPLVSGGKRPSHFRLTEKNFLRLEQIHAACRYEVISPDPFTAQALEHLRLETEVLLARSGRRRGQEPDDDTRLELAVQWLRQNDLGKNPVSGLSDYLQLSASTIHRLFRAHLRVSPARCHRELWMRKAAELLSQGQPVKAVAFALGYRFPNDFSRSFKRQTGRLPTRSKP